MNKDTDEESNFQRRQELRSDEESFRLKQEERRLKTGKRSATFVWIINTIYFLVGFLEILLTLRFLLRLFGANTENQFTQFVYHISAPFMTPFSTLFISPVADTGATDVNVLDVNVLMAIMVYALLCWLGVSLVRFVYGRYR